MRVSERWRGEKGGGSRGGQTWRLDGGGPWDSGCPTWREGPVLYASHKTDARVKGVSCSAKGRREEEVKRK